METKKVNRCDKDGFCEAQCLEDQKTCLFFAPAKTLFPGQCVHLMFKGNCLSPDALTAKWKELKEKKEMATDGGTGSP